MDGIVILTQFNQLIDVDPHHASCADRAILRPIEEIDRRYRRSILTSRRVLNGTH
jgi:hypothetical protein